MKLYFSLWGSQNIFLLLSGYMSVAKLEGWQRDAGEKREWGEERTRRGQRMKVQKHLLFPD